MPQWYSAEDHGHRLVEMFLNLIVSFSLSGLVHAWSVDSFFSLSLAVLALAVQNLACFVVGRVMMPVNRPPPLSNHHTQAVLDCLCTDAYGSRK